MRTQADQAPSLPLLIGGVVAILLGTSGFAAVMAWTPALTTESGMVFAQDEFPTPPVGRVGAQAPRATPQGEGDTRPTVKCAGCGVIASMREIRQPATGIDFGTAGGTARRGQSDLPGESTRSYEVTVRMNDGSNHVFMDSKPANWNESARQRFLIGVDQVQLSVSAR
jgi:hypothetical protein